MPLPMTAIVHEPPFVRGTKNGWSRADGRVDRHTWTTDRHTSTEHRVPRRHGPPGTSRISRVVTLVAVVVPPLGLLVGDGPAVGRRLPPGRRRPARGALRRSARSARRSASTGSSRTAASRRAAPVKAVLAILGCMTMQGPVTQWVTDHRKHHALSDKPGDPHSPHVGHGDGASAARRAASSTPTSAGSFIEPRAWSRGAIRARPLRGPARPDDRPPLPALGRRSRLGIPFAIGYAVGGTWQARAARRLVWGGLVRIFLYQHATFSVNSICHMFGRQDYRSRDEARNNWLVALLVFGEGWHNNHHAFPASARHGLDRRQSTLVVGDPRARAARARVGREGARRRAARAARGFRAPSSLKPQLDRRGAPRRPRAAAGPAARARARRSRAARRGSARSSPATPSARARSKPRRELAGDTPGTPGSQRSSDPWSTARRRPRSGSSESRSGIQGASPTTRSTDGSPAAAIATAPPIENPSSSVRARAGLVARPRARPRRSRSSRFHDLMRYRTSTNARCGKRGASRRTSHSSEALQVPATRAGLAAVHADDDVAAGLAGDAHLRPGGEGDDAVTRGAQGRARAGPGARRGRRRPSA